MEPFITYVAALKTAGSWEDQQHVLAQAACHPEITVGEFYKLMQISEETKRFVAQFD